MRTLRDWTAGDSVRNNDHHQQAVDALRELRGTIPPNAGGPSVAGAYPEEWTGKIVAHGKDENGKDISDYTDARYWVEKQFVLPGYTDDGEASAALASDASGQAGVPDGQAKPPTIFTVTNLPELAPDGADAPGGPKGTHLLPVGTVVRVWAEYDGGDPNRKRYLMDVDPFPCAALLTTAPAQDGTNRRWAYKWKRAAKTGAAWAGWVAATDAVEYDATNTLEATHDGTETVYGNGVTLANLPDGFDLVPVPAGVVVDMYSQLATVSGNLVRQYIFTVPNGVDGTCPTDPGDGGTP